MNFNLSTNNNRPSYFRKLKAPKDRPTAKKQRITAAQPTTATYIDSTDQRGSRPFYPPFNSAITKATYDDILAGKYTAEFQVCKTNCFFLNNVEFQVPTMPQQREQSYFATINSLANLQINFFDKHTPPTRHRSKEDIVAGYFQTYGLLPPHIKG